MTKNISISILGSGWLGLPLAEHFLQKGFQVKASTRSESRVALIQSKNVPACIFDIENIEQSELSFLAAEILVINITSKNISAFAQLIQYIEKSSIEKVIFVSSSSVYPNLNRVISEDQGVELKDSKLYQIESLFRTNDKFQTTILRLSGLIGYSRHPGRWFATRPISQANAPVNLIHRDDCISIIEQIIYQDAWGEAFNGVADTHPTKREYYSHARRLLNQNGPDTVSGETLSYKIISNAKIKNRLNYNFIYPDLMDIRFED